MRYGKLSLVGKVEPSQENNPERKGFRISSIIVFIRRVTYKITENRYKNDDLLSKEMSMHEYMMSILKCMFVICNEKYLRICTFYSPGHKRKDVTDDFF